MAQDNIPPDRLPPRSQEAERSVLGSMLRENSVIDDVSNIIRADSFYEDGHQKLFQAILDLHNIKQQPVDLVTLGEELIQRKQVEDVGGLPYLAELWESTPTAANAVYYASIVRERALVRSLIHASTEVLRDAYDQAQPADEMLANAERKILEIAERGTTGKTITLEEAINTAFTRIDERHQGGNLSISGLSTGFTDLDEITAGLQSSELIVIAARPSVGKTAFSLGLVRNIAVDERQTVFFVSLEQSRIEIAERLLCCQARVDSHKLRKGNLSRDDMDKLIEAGGILREAQLHIDDTPGQSMLRIAANARRLKLRKGLKLVVIDYLQLIEPESRRDPRQEQVAQISRKLKFLAKELEIPVVALAQVNRSAEDRQDHRPRLADLRESGCLAGDTLVTLADTGKRVPIRDLVGKSGFNVWALDETTMKLKLAEVSHAFCTGRKPVFRLTTRLGRSIRATANHKFRAFEDWCRLDELKVGDRIATPQRIPVFTAKRLHNRAGGKRSATPGTGPRETISTLKGLHNIAEGVVEPFQGSTSRDAERFPGVALRLPPALLCNRFAVKTNAASVRVRSSDDVCWDQIVSIEWAGEEDVFDLTVPGPSNFIGDSVIVHNSIEQDADTVMLLHRPDRYEPGQHEGIIEVIIGKQRNGPTGEITLAYLKQYLRFENYAVGTPFES